MRIAEIAPPWFTVPPLGYGGIEQVVSNLTEGLVEEGHDVTLFASPGSSTRARLVSPLSSLPDPARLGDAWLETIHAVFAHTFDEPFDVVHDHSGLVGLAMAATKCGSPVVHTLHGPWTGPARQLYGQLDQRVHLVAISDAQRNHNNAVRYAGSVHNGIDLSRYRFRAEKDDYLVFLGRANREKGPAQAINVAKQCGLPLKMVVKRNEPAEIAFWDSQVAPLLTADVEVYGEVSHEVKVDLVGGARALLFPIQWEEPFGLVMVEAMACGTPVIATKRGSVPEVVLDRETGFVCESVGDMAHAVESLDVIDPGACRAVVDKHFSASRMVDGYASIFADVVDSHGAVR